MKYRQAVVIPMCTNCAPLVAVFVLLIYEEELSHELSSPLCSLFNKSLTLGNFQVPYKDAIVSPVHKKGDLSLVTN